MSETPSDIYLPAAPHLSGMPKGAMFGYQTTATDEGFDVLAGVCRNEGNSGNLIMPATASVKWRDMSKPCFLYATRSLSGEVTIVTKSHETSKPNERLIYTHKPAHPAQHQPEPPAQAPEQQ